MSTTATFLFFILLPFILIQSDDVTLSEIQALTSFKQQLDDPLSALDGWDASTPSAPCDWRGISCYNNRVHELRLPRLQLAGQLSNQLGNLHQLRKLSLHSNNLNGYIHHALSQCKLLRAVYLQNNSFSGDLPPSIVSLTNLQVLNVGHNFLSGKISGDISNSLRFLDVSFNTFSGDMPANFSSESQLQLINLSYNNFSGQVPASIGQLQRLEYLWLDKNQFYGTLPSAIANCTSLLHLSVEDNSLRGLIPASFSSISKLELLSLSGNELSGNFPASIFCGVRNVSSSRIVKLGFNAFTGFIEPPNGVCVSVLEVLDMHENRLRGFFPYWLTKVNTLRVIDLSGNFFSGNLPLGIGHFSRLEELRVANNSMRGEIPTEILQCGSLSTLDVEGNKFSGLIPSFLGEMRRLKVLSLAGNLFSGLIPASLGGLSQLEVLNLNNNDLTGNVPKKIMRLSNLATLNLGFNNLSGGIPIDIGNLKTLSVLNLSACGFSGTVPGSIGSLLKLTVLDLSKQHLFGDLPIELFGLPSLQVVALQENRFSGNVPEAFSSLVGLQYLNLSSNLFASRIPATYGFLKSVVVVSLSGNRISGTMPAELGNCSSLEVLELHSNHLKGSIPIDVSRLSKLKKLDLGQNNLTGEIPENISRCFSLLYLSLDFNHLSGHIPVALSMLSNLTVLNLSSNNLTGVIPANISEIPSLRCLNLSTNNLEGEIPQLLAYQFNNPSSFSGNVKLCGKPLDRECPRAKWRKLRRLILLIGVAVAGALILALCCCGYVYSLIHWRRRLREGVTGEKKRSPHTSSGAERGRGSGENGGPKLVMFNNKITYAETLEATRQFDEENVLSRGRYGLVFKASYQDGMVLSICRLQDGSIDEGTFRKEVELLGKIKHKNLTVLRGYYAGPPDVRLLVYDYMPNGNLATLLQEASHRDGHALNWPMRHLIALGIARGLAFLHSITMVHGDIKPQNVLFDADFEAHLSEFGLGKLTTATPAEASTSSTPIGSVGYVSPEAALIGQPTKEADVYSFGIISLEILTGRKPIMFTQDEDIVKWVKRQLQRGDISELLEPGLLELDPESSEWEEFLLGIKVGLLCTAPDPIDRPSMTDIVFMLEGCRVGPDVPSSADPTSLPSPV